MPRAWPHFDIAIRNCIGAVRKTRRDSAIDTSAQIAKNLPHISAPTVFPANCAKRAFPGDSRCQL